MNADRGRHDGLSLLEVLVVVIVITIILALTVPAVLAARESSRRTQCVNNLKQIGVALANHVDTMGSFPQGASSLSALSRLLPYLDHESLYNTLNYNTSILENLKGIINRTARETRIDVFLCPSDTTSPGRFAGPCNYGCNVGYGFGSHGGAAGNGPFGGVVSFHPKVELASIRDGTSNTAALSEFRRHPDPMVRDPRSSVFEVGDIQAFDTFLARCRGIDPAQAKLSPVTRGRSWLYLGLDATEYNHNMLPNGYSCARASMPLGAWTAGSFHQSGVNVLYIDGRVGFVKDSVSLNSWHSLGSVAGGEIARLAD